MNELNQKDVPLNDANQKLREVQKEFEICKIKLDETQRSCDMKLTDFEIIKAKELSALKREISLSQQMINENRTTKESQLKELSEIKERHAIEIQTNGNEGQFSRHNTAVSGQTSRTWDENKNFRTDHSGFSEGKRFV